TAKYALERDPDTVIVAVEPTGSLYRSFFGEDPDEEEYKTEGIGTHDPTTNELFEPELVDDIIQVPDERAHAEIQRLAAEEGHLAASSSAANSLAARNVAEQIAAGAIDAPKGAVVTFFPDSSERYLSKGIYGKFEEWQG
ncbi:MAG: pyridoxal-phosphate dependent enzyme, partial [Halobacteriaceae archaeon]